MTIRAVQSRPAPVPVRVPAVASLALEPLLSSGNVNASVLGASSHAVWLHASGDVVVVAARDATRLPNGVEIAATSKARLLESVADGTSALIGSNSIEFGGLMVDVVRWWDPRPALPRTKNEDLGAAIGGLQHSAPGVNSASLLAALATTSSADLFDASMALLGRGPGLTPEGDDVLAGALAAIRTFGTALGHRPALAMLDDVEGALTDAANRRTTAFSAALIRCAMRGEVAAPAGDFLRALAGRGDVGASHRDLLRVGHTSGPALAAGIVLGALSLIEADPRRNGGVE